MERIFLLNLIVTITYFHCFFLFVPIVQNRFHLTFAALPGLEPRSLYKLDALPLSTFPVPRWGSWEDALPLNHTPASLSLSHVLHVHCGISTCAYNTLSWVDNLVDGALPVYLFQNGIFPQRLLSWNLLIIAVSDKTLSPR